MISDVWTMISDLDNYTSHISPNANFSIHIQFPILFKKVSTNKHTNPAYISHVHRKGNK